MPEHPGSAAILLYMAPIPYFMSEDEIGVQKLTALDMLEHNRPLREHWIKRIIAALIDWVIVLITATITGFFIGAGVAVFSAGLNAILAVFWVLYSALMEYLYGATIGKMMLGLKVQSLKGPLRLSNTLLRNLSKIQGLILLVDTIVGMATTGDPRQRFMDRLADTTVISTGRPEKEKNIPESEE